MKNVDHRSGENVSSLAAKLRRFRLQVGFSQKNVADELNVSRSTYTYYETGKTTPDPSTLNRIARIFRVSLEDFFTEEPANDPTAMLHDSGAKRPPKKAEPNPQKVGELTAGEKDIVAFLRDQEISESIALDVLKNHFTSLDIQRKMY